MAERKILNNLWTYRKKNGLSQRKVAFLLGHKGSSQLSHYERGAKLPSLKNALRLEIIYHVPVAFLFRELHEGLRMEIRKRGEKAKSKEENKANNNDPAST